MGGQKNDDYTGIGLSRISQARAQVLITVTYRLPILALLGASFAWVEFWPGVLLWVGAFAMLSDLLDAFGLLLRVGAFLGAFFLGAPLWLILTIAGVSTALRWAVKSVCYLVARWFPSCTDPQVWIADCRHLGAKRRSIRSLAELGRWSDALDASLQALADHPHPRTDCLAEVALMTAELAVAACAPEIATHSAKAAPRLTDSQSKTHRAIDVRSHLAIARAEALQGGFERAWSATTRAAENVNKTRQLAKLVKAVADGISTLTKRSSPDPERLISEAAQTLGIRGDAVDAILLDYADWYRSAGLVQESLNLYDLARSVTEFDRFIGEIDGIPKVLGPRWSLRGRRWARAVAGQLQARLALGQRPSDPLLKAAESAAAVLLSLGERPALVQLLAAIGEADAKHGARDNTDATLQAAESMRTRHRYLVFDLEARKQWEGAVERVRKYSSELAGSTTPAGNDPVPADATWLAGEGTQVARAGVALAKALTDLLADRYPIALRVMAMRLGLIGLKEEALEAAEEVVRIQRRRDGANLNPSWHLGIPLWRLGICREEVGRTAEGLAAHLESLTYFRQAAALNDSERSYCAAAVRDCVVRLMDAERLEDALPLALEAVRRYTELAPSAEPTESVDLAMHKLAQVYDRLDRHADSAQTSLKLAGWWEASTRNAIVAHAGAAEAFWRASRAWRRAKQFDDEFTALTRAYEHMSAIDDPEYSTEWQVRRRLVIGARFGKVLMVHKRAYAEAIPPLREALENVRRLPTNEPRWRQDVRVLLLRLAECIERTDPQATDEVISLRRDTFDVALAIEHDAEGDWMNMVENSAYLLATSYSRAGQPAAALSVVDEALTIIPPSAPLTLWLHYAAYLACTAVADSSRAELELRAATELAKAMVDKDPAEISVLTRCVIFLAAGDDARAMAYIDAATVDGNSPDYIERRDLWSDLADLERAMGTHPTIDRIRRLLPLTLADEYRPDSVPQDVFGRMDPIVRRVIVDARTAARQLGHRYLGTEHLLLGLLRHPGEATSLLPSTLTLDWAFDEVRRLSPAQTEPHEDQVSFTARAKQVLRASAAAADRLNHREIQTLDILEGLTRIAGIASKLLGQAGVTAQTLAGRPATAADSGQTSESEARSAHITQLTSQFDHGSRSIIEQAATEATGLGSSTVGCEHLLLAILAAPDQVANRALAEQGMSYQAVRDYVAGMRQRPAASSESRVGTDLVAVLDSAITFRQPGDRQAALGPRDLVLALVREPSAVAKAVLDSYAVTPESLARFIASQEPASDTDSKQATVASSAARPEPRLPDTVAGASPLVHAVVLEAMRENLTLDGFVRKLLTFRDELHARVRLTLRGLDVDSDELADLIAADAPSLRRDDTDEPDSDLPRVIDDLPRWLVRTGDRQPDTVHLLLAALSVAPKSAFAKALRTYGVTSDLLVVTAVGVRSEIGIKDKPGAPATLTPTSRRGAAPQPSSTQQDPLRKLAGARYRRRLFRGSSPTGDSMNSDLHMRRVSRWSVATALASGSGLVYGIVLFGSAITTGNWWLLVASPLAGIKPEILPVPAWLAACAVGAYFLPWPAQVALVLIVFSYAMATWLELQWRKSDTADPTFNLKRLRRDTRTSQRAMFLGGPS